MHRTLSFRLLLSLACLPGLLPGQALADPISTSPRPPQTGLESPDTPLKGHKMPVIGGFLDAYGNPITGVEEEREPRKRLPGGAYGGKKEVERPLPDPRDDRPVW